VDVEESPSPMGSQVTSSWIRARYLSSQELFGASGGGILGMATDKRFGLDKQTPTDVVRRFNTAWVAGEVDRAIAVVAEDAVYALHLSDDLLPTGGETIGRANIELRKVCRQFDYLLYGRSAHGWRRRPVSSGIYVHAPTQRRNSQRPLRHDHAGGARPDRPRRGISRPREGRGISAPFRAVGAVR